MRTFVILGFCLLLGVQYAQGTSEPKAFTSGVCRVTLQSDTWRVGCNSCQCVGGRPYCTLRECTAVQTDVANCQAQCSGSSSWKIDCNWCRCLNGRAVCTRRACPPICTPAQRAECPENRMLESMLVKGCKPVYSSRGCCATHFICPEPSVGPIIPEGKCYYQGRTFNSGDSIPEQVECKFGCNCGGPNIFCAQPRCGRPYPLNPGCWIKYSLDGCCPSNEAGCPETHPAKCNWSGTTYNEGERMSFSNDAKTSCQKCICSAQFIDPFGPQCKKIECGYDLSSTSQKKILSGCVPVFQGSSCCAYQFLCPTDSTVNSNQVIETDETKRSCKFGYFNIPLGGQLLVSDSKLKCQCLTPPDLLCVKEN